MSIDQPTSAFINGFLDNLQPGENIYQAIRDTINLEAFPPISANLRSQIYVLIVGHGLILVLSVVGVIARYYRKSAWLFARDDNGFLRPNTAIMTQICFALYSLFVIVDSVAYSLQSKASAGAFTLLVLTFIPLGAAFHFTTWATILAPKTSVKFLSSSNRGRNGISTHGRMWSWVAIGALVVFIAAVTVPTVFLSLTHSTEYAAIDYLFTQLDEAEAANTGIAGLVVLLPTYATINGIAGSALVRYRALCGTYFAFAMLWMIVYIPAATRLLLALRSREHRLTRSVRSLKVLDDIVSGEREITDDFKEKDEEGRVGEFRRTHQDAELGLVVQFSPNSSQSSFSPPTLDSPSYLGPHRPLSAFSPALDPTQADPADELETITITRPPLTFKNQETRDGWWSPESLVEVVKADDGLESERSMLKKVREKRANHERAKAERMRKASLTSRQSSRSTAHVDDLQRQLARTRRMFHTILVQFVVTMVIFIPYFALLICTNIFSFQRLNTEFAPWTGWAFVVPGLAGSFTFALFSLRGPRLVPVAPTNFAPAPPEEQDYAPNTASPKVRILDPRDAMRAPSRQSGFSSNAAPTIFQKTIGVFGFSSTEGVGDGTATSKRSSGGSTIADGTRRSSLFSSFRRKMSGSTLG